MCRSSHRRVRRHKIYEVLNDQFRCIIILCLKYTYYLYQKLVTIELHDSQFCCIPNDSLTKLPEKTEFFLWIAHWGKCFEQSSEREPKNPSTTKAARPKNKLIKFINRLTFELLGSNSANAHWFGDKRGNLHCYTVQCTHIDSLFLSSFYYTFSSLSFFFSHFQFFSYSSF